MKCLRTLVGVSRMDRDRNEEVRRRAGIERELELATRADQRQLTIEMVYIARSVLMAEISGGRVRGRPRLDG